MTVPTLEAGSNSRQHRTSLVETLLPRERVEETRLAYLAFSTHLTESYILYLIGCPKQRVPDSLFMTALSVPSPRSQCARLRCTEKP